MSASPLPPAERSALLTRLLGRGGMTAPAAPRAAGGACDFATLPAAREIEEIRLHERIVQQHQPEAAE